MNILIVDADLGNLQHEVAIDDAYPIVSPTIDMIVGYVLPKAMCYNPLNYLGLVIASISKKLINFGERACQKKALPRK